MAEERRQAVPVDEAVEAAMRAMGATDEAVAQARAERAGEQKAADEAQDAFEVYEDNWEDWMFFLRVQVQWVHAGLDGRRVCLNWAGIAAFAGMAGVRHRRLERRTEALEVIERAVLREDKRIAAEAERTKKSRTR